MKVRPTCPSLTAGGDDGGPWASRGRRRRRAFQGNVGAGARPGSQRGSVGPTCPLATCGSRKTAGGVRRSRRPSHGCLDHAAILPDIEPTLRPVRVNSAKYPCSGRSTWETSVPAMRAVDKLADILAEQRELPAADARARPGARVAEAAAADVPAAPRPPRWWAVIGRRWRGPRQPLVWNHHRACRAVIVASGTRLSKSRRSVQHYDKLPWRDPTTDAPIVVACQNFKGWRGQVDDLREPGALPGAQGLPGAGGGHRQPGDHDVDVRLRAGCRDRRGLDHPAVPVGVPDDARLRGAQDLLAATST